MRGVDPLHAPPSVTTLRGVQRFRCLGDACEANCCNSWEINFDEAAYQRLKTAYDGSAEDRALFAASVAINEGERARRGYASMRVLDGGSCGLLGPTGLCTVHARFGESVLPPICSSYPRVVTQIGPAVKVWGQLSCPEMVRQCVVADDGVDVIDGGTAPRLAGPPGSRDKAYDRALDGVRQLGAEVLSQRAFPLATRLAVLERWAYEVADRLNQQVDAIDEQPVAEITRKVVSASAMADLHTDFLALPIDPTYVATRLFELLHRPQRGLFHQLATAMLAGAGDAAAEPLRFFAAMVRRRAAWEPELGPALDRWFESYAKHFWLAEWFSHRFSVSVRVRALLLRVAFLRNALFLHPALPDPATLDAGARRATLERALVDLVFRFSRAFEHREGLTTAITATVIADVDTFSHALALARAC